MPLDFRYYLSSLARSPRPRPRNRDRGAIMDHDEMERRQEQLIINLEQNLTA